MQHDAAKGDRACELCNMGIPGAAAGLVGRLFLGFESKEARPVTAPRAVALPQAPGAPGSMSVCTSFE